MATTDSPGGVVCGGHSPELSCSTDFSFVWPLAAPLPGELQPCSSHLRSCRTVTRRPPGDFSARVTCSPPENVKPQQLNAFLCFLCRWLAPEVLAGKSYDCASDVYSFGMILWEMMTWQVPWEELGPWQVGGC